MLRLRRNDRMKILAVLYWMRNFIRCIDLLPWIDLEKVPYSHVLSDDTAFGFF